MPAPTPGSARLNAHQADVGFRFSCTGKATHVVQPPAKPGGKVVLPYCEGLEVRPRVARFWRALLRVSSPPHGTLLTVAPRARCLGRSSRRRPPSFGCPQILASSQQVTDTVVSGRHAAQHEHGDAPTGRPQSPPLGDAPRGALPGPAAVLDLGAFYEKWKKSANKIAQRMQDNVEATVALLTGGGRRGG